MTNSPKSLSVVLASKKSATGESTVMFPEIFITCESEESNIT